MQEDRTHYGNNPGSEESVVLRLTEFGTLVSQVEHDVAGERPSGQDEEQLERNAGVRHYYLFVLERLFHEVVVSLQVCYRWVVFSCLINLQVSILIISILHMLFLKPRMLRKLGFTEFILQELRQRQEEERVDEAHRDGLPVILRVHFVDCSVFCFTRIFTELQQDHHCHQTYLEQVSN